MPKWRGDPAKVRPMLASLDEPPIVQEGLVYEPKYDGIRALVDLRPPARRGPGPHVALYSRNGRDKAAQFPEIVAALEKLVSKLETPLLLDAEIVAIDADGTPLGFGNIQRRIHLKAEVDIARARKAQPAALILFDLLRDGAEDLRGKPLAERRLRLQQRVKLRGTAGRVIRLSEIATDDGREMLKRAEREWWEGLIVKDGHSVYHSGRRTPAWRKLKLHEQQELVVGGWTDPKQSRHHFGALLLGVRKGRTLQYAGSVGTGFDEAELERVAGLLAAREAAKPPFAAVPKSLARAHWVKPTLVAEVRFTEWTNDGMLRHPVYLGLREDKPAGRVRRETAPGKAKRRRPTPTGSKAPEHDRPSADLAGLIKRLAAMEDARKDGILALPNGDQLRVTNLGKVFWPNLGITKGDVLRYYVEVSPWLLPAVDDRPLVMRRFPNGIDKPAFYQQRHPEKTPPGVRREAVDEEIDPIDEKEKGRERLVGGSLTTLLYMAQLASISQDPWFSRVTDPPAQDYAAIDLDPGEGATFAEVLDVARWVKDELDRLDIPAVPKTSGATGLHIYIPLPPHTPYDTGQVLCHIIATMVVAKHPKVATIERLVRKRPHGTIYVDYLQNILGKTLATAYSVRASDYAGVSTPLTWADVEEGVDPHDFTIRTALTRFHAVGDLWARLRMGPPADLRALLEKKHGVSS
jgi:bifunctional non-homologous end joining protein LigD